MIFGPSCWWCNHPLKTRGMDPTRKFLVVLHDGQTTRVHRSCQVPAAEYVRLSKMTAQDPTYAIMPQHEQIRQAALIKEPLPGIRTKYGKNKHAKGD